MTSIILEIYNMIYPGFPSALATRCSCNLPNAHNYLCWITIGATYLLRPKNNPPSKFF